MNYRPINKNEITALQSQGCFAENWADISVKDGFSTAAIFNTRFSGKIKLGIFTANVTIDGIVKKCGIYNSFIQGCDVAGQVYISDVKNLSNYRIGDNVCIENVASLTVTGETTFGNGTEIEVFNEGGGRELPIFDTLSSQIAYLTVAYRHDADLTSKLTGIIKAYCESKKSKNGEIETGTKILHSLIIRNVNIGSYTEIVGASLLEEGTIKSCKEAPVFIGEKVIAKKFIVQSGSRIDGGAIIDKTFIGQGSKIGKQFSAENSTFFANCEGFHGEACSLFAGPYTVTHHKSTLMIAGLFSFFNAGSGTNQSNHMYKLGPLHQGVLERGSKTGSFSYLLWPCHVGPFTAVVGKHLANFDTADFPFSYITENKGKSMLTPAMNLFTVGTRRDSEKWPSRDRRKDPEKQDLIHFDLFSPYIVGKIVNAISILNELNEQAQKTQEYVTYKGITIPRLILKTTRKYYEMALRIYLGSEVMKRLEGSDDKTTIADIRKKLVPQSKEGAGKWVDILGLLSPASKIEELTSSIKTGQIKTISDLKSKLKVIFDNYSTYSWVWWAELIRQNTNMKIDEITAEALITLVSEWKSNFVKINNMIQKDAEKEFDANSKIGFGLDGDENIRNKDFESIRGTYEGNKFVIGLKKESEESEKKADRLLSILEKIK